jgi:hypothetical protein
MEKNNESPRSKLMGYHHKKVSEQAMGNKTPRPDSVGIQYILDELYQVDPELKNHQVEIAAIVTDMMKHKPHTQFDEQFARELKVRVLEKFSLQARASEEKKFSFFISRLVYTLGGAFATLAIAVPILYTGSNLTSDVMENSFTAGTRVVRAEANAFGPLVPVSLNASVGESDRAGGGAMGMGGDATKMSATSFMYNPEYVNYKFTFAGDMPELQDSVEVLKRESGMDAAKQYAGILQKIKLGIFDLGKMMNAHVQNFSLAEDRDKGYVVNVDMVGGYVSISENYSKWYSTRPMIDCPNGFCVDPNRITIDEVPEEGRLVAIADSFLREYGIDVSAYGAGKVDTRWRIGYERAENKSEFYISHIQTVLYQLMIEGKPVYEEYGEPMGIRVNINTKEMRVASVDGIMTKTFSGSSYVGETDETRLRTIIEKGRMAVYAEPTKTVDVELQNVEEGYMRQWKYSENDGTSSEIFVPALIVEVKDFERLQGEGLWQSKIVIPLASEMLSELEKQAEEPIQIMPFEVMPGDAVSEPAVEPRG